MRNSYDEFRERAQQSRRPNARDDFDPEPKPSPPKSTARLADVIPEAELGGLDTGGVLRDIMCLYETRAVPALHEYDEADLVGRREKFLEASNRLAGLRGDVLAEVLWRHRSHLVPWLMR